MFICFNVYYSKSWATKIGLILMDNLKDIIAEEYLNLIKEYDFDKVTVSDIIKKCNISRQTFYSYFKDKYDIISYNFRNKVMENLEFYRETKDLKKYFENIIHFTYLNKDLIKKIKTSKYNAHIENLMIETKMEEINKVLEMSNKTINADHLKFYSEIFVCAYSNLSYRYCDKDLIDIDKITDLLVEMFDKIFDIK